MDITKDCPPGWKRVGPSWLNGCNVRHTKQNWGVGIVVGKPGTGSGPFPRDLSVTCVFWDEATKRPKLWVVLVENLELAS